MARSILEIRALWDFLRVFQPSKMLLKTLQNPKKKIGSMDGSLTRGQLPYKWVVSARPWKGILHGK